jgi:hypothetical protein
MRVALTLHPFNALERITAATTLSACSFTAIVKSYLFIGVKPRDGRTSPGGLVRLPEKAWFPLLTTYTEGSGTRSNELVYTEDEPLAERIPGPTLSHLFLLRPSVVKPAP